MQHKYKDCDLELMRKRASKISVSIKAITMNAVLRWRFIDNRTHRLLLEYWPALGFYECAILKYSGFTKNPGQIFFILSNSQSGQRRKPEKPKKPRWKQRKPLWETEQERHLKAIQNGG